MQLGGWINHEGAIQASLEETPHNARLLTCDDLDLVATGSGNSEVVVRQMMLKSIMYIAPLGIVGLLATTAAAVNPWIQLGGVGVLGLILFVVVTKAWPDSLERQAKSHEKNYEHLGEKFSDVAEKLDRTRTATTEGLSKIDTSIQENARKSHVLLEKALGLKE